MSLAPGTQRVPLPCHATVRNVCVWNQGRECLSHLLSREHLDLRPVNRLLPCYPLPSNAGQHHDGGDNPTHTIQERELQPFLSNHLSVSLLLNLKLDLGTQPSTPQSERVNGNPPAEHGFCISPGQRNSTSHQKLHSLQRWQASEAVSQSVHLTTK